YKNPRKQLIQGNQENRATVYDNKIIDYINFHSAQLRLRKLRASAGGATAPDHRQPEERRNRELKEAMCEVGFTFYVILAAAVRH
uniref:Transposase n=1 Tax=Macrostomum lignano TaxID=282301 RepID=A0A1I8FN26_9PLAT